MGSSRGGAALGSKADTDVSRARSAAKTAPVIATLASAKAKIVIRGPSIRSIRFSIRRAHEAWLKIGAAVSLIVAVPQSAHAAELVVGAVRDTAGYPVEGAAIRLLTLAGNETGAGHSAADGTFAIETSLRVERIRVGCRYCVAVDTVFTPGAPVVIVRRFSRAIVGPPSAADIGALPPRTLPALESLVPFAVARGDAVSDRGLLRGADGTAFDGIDLYRRLDNAPLSSLVPATDAARIDQIVHTFTISSSGADAPRMRAGTANAGNATLRGFSNPVVTLGRAYDPSSTAVSIAGSTPLATGTLGGALLGVSARAGSIAGATLTGTVPRQGFDVVGAASAVRSNYNGRAESDVAFDVHVADRRPVALVAGFRGTFSTADRDAASAGARLDEAAYGTATTRVGDTLLRAGVSIEPRLNVALWASHRLTDTLHLDASYRQYAQIASLVPALRSPRARLAEIGLDATDARRLSARLNLYDERTSNAVAAGIAGIGLAVNYQLAPLVSLRAWALRAATAPLPYVASRATDAQLLWLTYDNGLRFDAIYRNGRPDVSVYMPLRGTGVSFGTHELHGHRTLSLDIGVR